MLGYLVEVISGQPFEKYLKEKVIDPLGMVDTDFHVPADKHERFAANYSAGAGGKLDLIDDPGKSRYLAPRKVNSGGGGLVSTAADYLRFCQFMLNKGELDGVRLLGRKTVELMTMNHLKGDMADMGTPRFSESTYTGIGFGLGFSVMIDPAKAHIAGTPGEYRLGRRRLDRLLDRPGGGHGRGAADPAHALLDLSDPPRAARAHLPGDRRLRSIAHAQHRPHHRPQAASAVRRGGLRHRHHAAARRPASSGRSGRRSRSTRCCCSATSRWTTTSRSPSARTSGRSRRPAASNPAAGTKFQRQSNLDIMTGEPIPPDDMRMIYQKANYFWHSDSSFKRIPSLCSILTARICPPEGGNTEFLNMRAAWDALPPALQATIHPLVAEHALAHSRDRVQKGILSAKALSELPPVKQRLFRDNPINGRRALYIGAHAGHIVDWPEPIGKAILYELTYRAEQPEFVLSHAWREGDVIVWDNRAVLHRATYYDAVKHKRLMQRTTIGGDELTVPQ